MGLAVENLNDTINPGDDFYEYACGGWMAANPLKPEYSRFGTFDKLSEDNREQVRGLIEEQSKIKSQPGSVAQKIGTLYAEAMDSVKLNADGAAPLKPYIADIEAMSGKGELPEMMAAMFKKGWLPFFGAYVYADDKNSSQNIFHLMQGGYHMGDRDYYIDTDEKTKSIRAKYEDMVRALFTLSGYSEAQAADALKAVMKIETHLAKAAYAREALRDPEANYHKMTLDELKKLCPEVDWSTFFSKVGIASLADLNVGQPEPVAEAGKVIASSSLQEIKYYLSWNAILGASSFLSDDFAKASFEFYGRTLSGAQEMRPRWKRAVGAINGVLGEAVGQLYVEKYFPPAAKERMLKLVHNLQASLGERIDNLPWMSDSTKMKAQEKLAAFHIKIGYPDKWRSYEGLDIKDDSYLANIVRSNIFDMDYMLSKWGKPVDRDEWLMTPQTVNAYYNPITNEICFPAAILQPPFFNMEADDAVNYGAIGVVIGHEMTHGFDDMGRQFDKDGNLKGWWSESDIPKFNERADKLVAVFDKIVVIDSLHANGRFTLGENIADQGGLQIAYQAFQKALAGERQPDKIGGFTLPQRFFLSYANVWAGNIRDEEVRNLTKSDEHSLGRWRVNAALPQVDAWYEAFGIKESDKLYVPKEDRVFIW